MKYALIDGQRQDPQPGLKGFCQGCNQPMVARCGNVRIWHWSHIGELICDINKEPETEWHRNWKNHFPKPWQEVFHRAENGEKHIADVKTDQDYVLEFQHSPISLQERLSREDFYKKMVWVVDATRRLRDKEQFVNTIKNAVRLLPTSPVLKLNGSLDKSALLRDWSNNNTPVFFDFGQELGLWYLLPKSNHSIGFIVQCSHESFIKLHLGGDAMKKNLYEWLEELPILASNFVLNQQSRAVQPASIQIQRVWPQYNRRSYKRYRRRF